MTLAELESGKQARVTDFTGGPGMTKKLENLGLLRGRIVKKISNNPFRGPVVVRIDQLELAIGHGMATRIMVEPL
ncbi:MAG: ferrous iron transport protein A [Deltaproteobacteria bacterium]|nr:ferrous iron transport protein A [Candidatus Anaeroferrophillus wilburensis]MBN2888185.1 ferrous iron transport protein A [Deltaproteobacteria bacterium]